MYFAPIPLYRQLYKVDTLELEAHENYNKSSYRNRMEIATSNGKLTLSIPLTKENIKDKLLETYRSTIIILGLKPTLEEFANCLQ